MTASKSLKMTSLWEAQATVFLKWQKSFKIHFREVTAEVWIMLVIKCKDVTDSERADKFDFNSISLRSSLISNLMPRTVIKVKSFQRLLIFNHYQYITLVFSVSSPVNATNTWISHSVDGHFIHILEAKVKCKSLPVQHMARHQNTRQAQTIKKPSCGWGKCHFGRAECQSVWQRVHPCVLQQAVVIPSLGSITFQLLVPYFGIVSHNQIRRSAKNISLLFGFNSNSPFHHIH